MHQIIIFREDQPAVSVTCETKSYLIHDLTHFAVETEARLHTGFQGLLAAGKTLEELNDRSGESIRDAKQELMIIESVVGVLHNIAKGKDGSEILRLLRSQGGGLGWEIPYWLNEPFVVRVKQRMRQLMGQWNATRYGESMEIIWDV